MTCKDCIHYDVCNDRIKSLDMFEITDFENNVENKCADFKDKSRITESPCKPGDNIFYLHRNSQGNNSIFKANVLGVVVTIYDNIKKIYLKVIYEDSDGYTDRATAIYGVNAFSSREEAVARLKELSK